MKKYTKPNLKVTGFSVEDVITASGSGVIVNADSFTGSNKEMYEIYSENSSVGNTNVSVFTW